MTSIGDRPYFPDGTAELTPEYVQREFLRISDALSREQIFNVTHITNSDSPYTVRRGDKVINANTTGGAITINLAAGKNDRIIYIKNTGAIGANDVTISPDGSDQIERLGTDLVLNPLTSARLVYSESEINWFIYDKFSTMTSASSTDNAVVRFDGVTGQSTQDSGVIIDDSDAVTGVTNLTVDNVVIDGNGLNNASTDLTINATGGSVILDGKVAFTAAGYITNVVRVFGDGASNLNIWNNLNTSSLSLAGGTNSANGANILLHGTSSVGSEYDIEFRKNAVVKLKYDDSLSTWDFSANLITTTGLITGNDLTLTDGVGTLNITQSTSNIDVDCSTGNLLLGSSAGTVVIEGGTTFTGANVTNMGTLGCGAVTSTGDVRAENLRLTEADPVIVSTASTNSLSVSGGTTGSDGGNIILRASAPLSGSANDILFRSGTTVNLLWDDNGGGTGRWDFNGTDVTGINSLVGNVDVTGTFTSLGISDETTIGESLVIKNGTIEVGDGSAGEIAQIRSNTANDGSLAIWGGNNWGQGSSIHLYGGTTTGTAGDLGLSSGTGTFFYWNEDIGRLTIRTGAGASKTLALTIDNAQAATFAGTIDSGAITSTGAVEGTTVTDGAFTTTAGAVTGVTTLTVDNVIIDTNDVKSGLGNLNIRSDTGTVNIVVSSVQQLVINSTTADFKDNDITTTGGYQVSGTQVVGAQGAAVSDATDAASAITQLNLLLARCRAHGLIA